MPKYEQPFLDGFLEMEAEQREKFISDMTTQIHLAREFNRYEKMIRLCPNDHLKSLYERQRSKIIQLMSRQRN